MTRAGAAVGDRSAGPAAAPGDRVSAHLAGLAGLRARAHIESACVDSGPAESGSLHRQPAQWTWSRIQPHLRRYGITRVADVTGLDRLGIPVATAIQPRSRSLVSSQGKALTAVGARVGAAMEAIEAWCAALHVLPTIQACVAEVAERPDGCDFTRLAGFRARETNQPVTWTTTLELHAGEIRLVPYDAVHLDFRLPRPGAGATWTLSSVGLAAGNDLAEAVLHAVLEVAEHHAEAWWRALPAEARLATRVDLDSVGSSAAQLLERLRSRGVACALWRMTAEDCPIPVMFAGIVEDDPHRDLHTLPFATGSGAHTDPHVAAYRALIEAVQTRLTYISGARDDTFDDEYRHVFDTRKLAAARAAVDKPTPIRLPEPRPVASTADRLGDVLRILAAYDWDEVLAIELTPPGAPFAVARVIIPGMRRS